jgi:predicted PurR-regulated permease PerM
MGAAEETAVAPGAAAGEQVADAAVAQSPPLVETETRARRYSRATWSLVILAGIALVAALYLARAFFVPLLIGILASYTLRPLVDWLRRFHVPQALGAALVLTVLTGGLSWIGYSLSDQATVMIEKLPEAARNLRMKLSTGRNAVPTALQNVQEAANELQRAATDVAVKPEKRSARSAPPAPPVADAAGWLRDYALNQSALLLSIAAKAPIILLLAYFLLASGDHFRRKLVQFVGPSISRKKEVLIILEEVDVQVQHYLLVMLVCNALVGFATWLALEAMGLEQAGVWGVFAGVMHFIPYLGPVVTAIAVGIAGFLQFGSFLHGLAVAGVTIFVAGMIGMVFMTWLQSRVARVNAAVLFIALLFFGWLWGVAGILLGAPLVAIVKVVCERIDALKPVGELLGS